MKAGESFPLVFSTLLVTSTSFVLGNEINENRDERILSLRKGLSPHSLPLLNFLSVPNDSVLDSTTSFQKTDAKMSSELECQPGCAFMWFLVCA